MKELANQRASFRSLGLCAGVYRWPRTRRDRARQIRALKACARTSEIFFPLFCILQN